MDREDQIKTAIVASVVALDAIGMAMLGLRFDWASAWKVIIAWPVLMALGWFYMTWRKDPPVAHLMRETAHLAAFTAAAAMLSYLAAGADRPLIDAALVAADRLMLFDWQSYVAFVNEREWLGRVSSLLYISTLPQVALAAILLPVLGMTERARELVLAVMIGALIAILVSAILPSAGALAHFRPDPEFYARSAPIVDLAYKDEFFRMRALEIPVLSLDGAKGLIAFPSYHVTLSVLIALAFRGRPFLFWPLLALNTGVILTTPIDGGHHLVDGVAGAAVAVAALHIAVCIRRAIHRPVLAAEAHAGAADGERPEAAARAIV